MSHVASWSANFDTITIIHHARIRLAGERRLRGLNLCVESMVRNLYAPSGSELQWTDLFVRIRRLCTSLFRYVVTESRNTPTSPPPRKFQLTFFHVPFTYSFLSFFFCYKLQVFIGGRRDGTGHIKEFAKGQMTGSASC